MEEKGTEMDMTNKIYDFFPEQQYKKQTKHMNTISYSRSLFIPEYTIKVRMCVVPA